MATELDIAWAAGLFEGEGCISTFPHQRYTPRVSVASKDGDVIRRLASVMGVGVVAQEKHSRGYPFWRWSANASNAVACLALMMPHFGERRRARAIEVLNARFAHVEEVTFERSCQNCERVFRPRFSQSSTRTKYCSRPCADAANNRKKRKKAAACR